MDDQRLTIEVGDHEFRQAFGESLRHVLDLGSWRSGEDLSAIYEHLAALVETAVRKEASLRDPLRERVFPLVRQRTGAPKGAGLYQAELDQVKRLHQGLLFTGAVEACHAVEFTYETLPLSVTQIGVSLVAYNGSQGTWVHRLFRRDLQESQGDPAEEALNLLELRGRTRRTGQPAWRDLSRLARRAITAYAERAILLYRSDAMWRLGQGNPAPYELLTGSAGTLDVMIEATKILEALICRHRTFVFVQRGLSDQVLSTLGMALKPLEYAIVETLDERIAGVVEAASYSLPTMSDTEVNGRLLTARQWIERFLEEIAPEVVVGVYRASEISDSCVFYAHVDHAHEAAHVALADSVLQQHRGVPMLLDLAEHMCQATFGPESLAAALQLGYARAGAPLEYLAGRMLGGQR
jgi:hypothetical protein